MLHILGREGATARMHAALLAACPQAAGQVVAMDYGRAIAAGEQALPAGAYAFLGVERLDDDSAFDVMKLHARLGRRAGVRCINHPTLTVHRYELLRILHDAGINPGDALRVEDRRLPARWPVYLRDELAPMAALPLLVHDREQFGGMIARMAREAVFRPPILICELPGADAGSATLGRVFHVGGRLIADPRGQALLARAGAPDAADIFRQARIDLGYLTLALVADRVVVVDSGTDPEQLVRPDMLPVLAPAMLGLAA